MPFYEYQCRACGHELEVLQKVSDPALKKCPACGKSQLTKLVSAPVFRLKGSGWYETDFKSDKDTRRNLVETEKERKPSRARRGESKPGRPMLPDTRQYQARGQVRSSRNQHGRARHR
jgi:putative FmdB family regulatory protein